MSFLHVAAELDRFSEAVAARAEDRVRAALELERDRHDAEIAELHRRLDGQAVALRALNELVTNYPAGEHSRRV